SHPWGKKMLLMPALCLLTGLPSDQCWSLSFLRAIFPSAGPSGYVEPGGRYLKELQQHREVGRVADGDRVFLVPARRHRDVAVAQPDAAHPFPRIRLPVDGDSLHADGDLLAEPYFLACLVIRQRLGNLADGDLVLDVVGQLLPLAQRVGERGRVAVVGVDGDLAPVDGPVDDDLGAVEVLDVAPAGQLLAARIPH